MEIITHPFADQASSEMRWLWAPETKVFWERQWWVSVMEAQASLGVDIPEEAIADYHEVCACPIDLSSIADREKVTRHDVKARLEEFNAVAGGHQHAHKGMTGRDLDDNVELIQIKRSLQGLAYQLESLGDRLNQKLLRSAANNVRLRGIWGPMGTGADMADLLGSVEKVYELNRMVGKQYGFDEAHCRMESVGQVYPRSLDYAAASTVLAVLMNLNIKVSWRSLVAGYTQMLAELAGGQWLEGDVSCSVVRRVALPGIFLAASAAIQELTR